jgi:thiamine biosynthesis lipoprotein
MNSPSFQSRLIDKEIKKKIMATDVYIGIAVEKTSDHKKKDIEKDIERSFEKFMQFQNSFSRFIKDNQLYKFNYSSGQVEVSQDLYQMLNIAKKYHQITKGVFDLSIYPSLVNEGYAISSTKGYLKEGVFVEKNAASINDLDLDKKNYLVIKPTGLKIELGGLGKGYIVDKVADYLKNIYENIIVDAGGDIYYAGRDIVHGYDHWVCEIETPPGINTELPLLTINNAAVATSGTYKKRWQKDGEIKSHLIDPRTGKSVKTEIVSCTIVASSTVKADILAKSILLMGVESGMNFAEEEKIATLMIDHNSKIYQSSVLKEYVWKP